ncbi:sulfotransferase domain-containing protein [Salinibacter altiplanensis]|uniref:sulfotransferase domain-containing protein n=1 Tax=Salinibacter altiplanensis TaxID=1803181 RepID=UPI00131A11BE|nr:sulfotransferase domain-containing protein [Salinibacter altiplanensis]
MMSGNEQGPLPDFLIIGVQKSGTSWLARMLRQHPDVYMPGKEVHYFDKVHNYRKGEQWYRSHFTDAGQHQTVGEKTPDYIWAHGDGVEKHDPDVHKNVYETLPQANLIVLLRNPVDRAVSAAKHIIRSGRVSPWYSLDELLRGEKQDRIRGHGVLEYGYYHQHLSAYLDLFSVSQLRMLFFEEDVVDTPEDGLAKVFRFLGLTATDAIEGVDEKVNAHRSALLELYAQYYAPRLLGLARRTRNIFPKQIEPPSEATIARLYDHYAEHNRRLAERMERSLPDSWYSPDLASE